MWKLVYWFLRFNPWESIKLCSLRLRVLDSWYVGILIVNALRCPFLIRNSISFFFSRDHICAISWGRKEERLMLKNGGEDEGDKPCTYGSKFRLDIKWLAATGRNSSLNILTRLSRARSHTSRATIQILSTCSW